MDTTKELEDLYRSGVTQALAGFQLLEENLKSYVEIYFDSIRLILDGRLHFDFKREEYQDAPLGRLVNVLAKTCSNKDLIAKFRAVVKKRDHIAHRALLRLYHGQPITTDEYPALLSEISETMQVIQELGRELVKEMKKVVGALGGA